MVRPTVVNASVVVMGMVVGSWVVRTFVVVKTMLTGFSRYRAAKLEVTLDWLSTVWLYSLHTLKSKMKYLFLMFVSVAKLYGWNSKSSQEHFIIVKTYVAH